MNKSDLLYKEKENKRKGFIVSLIFHIFILLLFLSFKLTKLAQPFTSNKPMEFIVI